MKPTLLILAAGMGSRYGGLKQIDGIGPNKEPIIEYSIYDAIKAGFGKIVFVIREEFDVAFRDIFDSFKTRIEIEYVYQPVNVNVDGLKSIRCCDKSLTLPFLSSAAGFSNPKCPTLNNFIFDLFFQSLCTMSCDLHFHVHYSLNYCTFL